MRTLKMLMLATVLLAAGVLTTGCVTVYESDEDRVLERRGPWAEGEVHDVTVFDVMDGASR